MDDELRDEEENVLDPDALEDDDDVVGDEIDDPLIKPKKDLLDPEETESLDDLEEDELDEDEDTFEDVDEI
jgi:hypothetical protein